ncbi:MAG: tRNA lysidine(34) synthetase TilS [Chthoniobacteraceae bacterium]
MKTVRRASEPIPTLAIPDSFSPDEPQLVGISGGRDSVVLLHWLHAHGFKKLIAVHLDHRLRPGSGGDAEFVRKFADSLGIEYITGTADVAALAKKEHLSIETAARRARHEFFARTAIERACPRIFLAHHADDQVETFLHNLLRGAGPSGLSGMSPVSTLEMHGTALLIARPLLGTWREEIDACVARHALPFREDESNTDPRFTRNRLRHSAIPALTGALGRDVRAALLRTTELLRAEDEFLSAQPELRGVPDTLQVPLLRSLPLALQRRLIHLWLARHAVASCGFAEVESVRSLLDSRGAKVNLPGGLCARRREKRIFIAPQ